jgi:hypothetical protein
MTVFDYTCRPHSFLAHRLHILEMKMLAISIVSEFQEVKLTTMVRVFDQRTSNLTNENKKPK